MFISSILRQHISANVIFTFEYFILRIEDKFERLFDTRLQSIQPGEVDEFRQPRVWILLQHRLQVHHVARTIRIHLVSEEFPGCIDSDFRKKCNQPEKGDVRENAREHKDAANPIRKSTINREGNDV